MKRGVDSGNSSFSVKKRKNGHSTFLQNIFEYVPFLNNWFTFSSNPQAELESEFPQANEEQSPEQEPPYKPLIHGTNARIFALLNKTNFLLLSSIDMVEQFGLAPMSGELFGGGLENMHTRCNPCFGSLGNQEGYDLESVIGYATTIKKDFSDNISMLNRRFEDASSGFFDSINESLVLLARIKQAGLFTLELHEKSLVMQKQLRGYIQYCYFQLLLGKYFDLDLENLEALLKHYPSSPYKLFLTTPFSMTAILEGFSNLSFNIKDIINNPSSEALSQILSVFQIPANEQAQTPAFNPLVMKKESKEINRLLVGTVHHSPGFGSRWQFCGASNFNSLTRNYVSYARDYYMHRVILNEMAPTNYQSEEEASLLEYIDEATHRAKILNDILMKRADEFKLTEEELFFIQNQFPIILICQNERFEQIKSEYRSLQPLQFGKDIKAIATDTEEHRFMLMRYFDLHRITHIKVFLIDDLKKSEETKREPLSPYAHKDSFPKLSWLAAKKVPVETTPPHNFPCVSKMMKAANYYHEQNLKRRKVIS